MQKHFVTFFSPGTFVAETTSKPIDSWDVEKAKEMAHDIVERYNSRPYGFQFSTRSRGPDDLDSSVSSQSSMYYLGGQIMTREEIEKRNDSKDEILLGNMRSLNVDRVVISNNSWLSTNPLNDGDVVLDWVCRE